MLCALYSLPAGESGNRYPVPLTNEATEAGRAGDAPKLPQQCPGRAGVSGSEAVCLSLAHRSWTLASVHGFGQPGLFSELGMDREEEVETRSGGHAAFVFLCLAYFSLRHVRPVRAESEKGVS